MCRSAARCTVEIRSRRHAQYSLNIECGAMGIGNEVRCSTRHSAVSGLHQLLLRPEINWKEKWNKVVNGDNNRTLQQRGRIKRTVKQIKLVPLLKTPKLEGSERRILPWKIQERFAGNAYPAQAQGFADQRRPPIHNQHGRAQEAGLLYNFLLRICYTSGHQIPRAF